MSSQPKWLRQAAAEIRAEGHAGWGNTCEQAADEFDALLLKLQECQKYWDDEKRRYDAADKAFRLVCDERDTLSSRLDDAEKQAEYNGNAARSVALRLADAESRLDALQKEHEALIHDHERVKECENEYLNQLLECELSLSVFDPGGSSEYWLRHHSPHEPVDEVRVRIKANAVEKHCTKTPSV